MDQDVPKEDASNSSAYLSPIKYPSLMSTTAWVAESANERSKSVFTFSSEILTSLGAFCVQSPFGNSKDSANELSKTKSSKNTIKFRTWFLSVKVIFSSRFLIRDCWVPYNKLFLSKSTNCSIFIFLDPLTSITLSSSSKSDSKATGKSSVS